MIGGLEVLAQALAADRYPLEDYLGFEEGQGIPFN